ncbi:MAG: cytochrome-c peroxidase, partial [Defluviicoccus sp.]|nr:cytochrome-c peroxidase [Defluviicoccus sp.]
MTSRLAVGLAGLSTAFGLLFGLAAPAPALDFTAEEVRRILRHGPWPPASPPDPGNRVSGAPAAIAFGRALFFDPRLSVSGTVSCATCHKPDRAWTDGLPRSRGHRIVDRNAPSLFNLRFNRWFGWDGAQDTLWAQNLRPLLDAREMGIGLGGAALLVRSDGQLACFYRHAFGEAPGADDERVFVDLGKALAAFLETLVTGRTPFDDFRDALAGDDAAGRARYPVAAGRGLRLFVGRGNCAFCHFGPAFTNGEFADAGV